MKHAGAVINMFTRGIWSRHQVWHLVTETKPERWLNGVRTACGKTEGAFRIVCATVDENRATKRRMCKACRVAAKKYGVNAFDDLRRRVMGAGDNEGKR